MKKHFGKFLFLIILLTFASCKKAVEKKVPYSQTSMTEEWNKILQSFYSTSFDEAVFLEQIKAFRQSKDIFYSPETNAYPDIRSKNTILINSVIQKLNETETLVNSGTYSRNELESKVAQISHDISMIEHNNFLSVKKTNHQYVQFFALLVICCFFIVGFLIHFNNKELKNAQTQLDASKQYLKYIIKTQEDERARISRELHDTVAQDMRYVGLLASQIPSNELAEEIQKRQSDCINQIRNLCYNFAPPDIKTGKLTEALQTFVAEFRQKSDIDLRLSILDKVDFSVFTTEEMLHIYRIIQEAVSNIEKHAKASEATILFRVDKNNGKKLFKLLITDDGIGISPEILEEINNRNVLIKKDDGTHFGIGGLKERVALLNGTIHFDSIAGEGTEIIVCVEK